MTVTLVTGASTGIGEATALHLSRLGHSVYASMRTPDASGGGLRSAAEEENLDLEVIALDVDDSGSVATATDPSTAMPLSTAAVTGEKKSSLDMIIICRCLLEPHWYSLC